MMNEGRMRLVSFGFTFSLLGTLALVSSTWMGPVLGVVGVILSFMGLKEARAQGGIMQNMVIFGIIIGCLDIVLLWIAPGVFHAIWG